MISGDYWVTTDLNVDYNYDYIRTGLSYNYTGLSYNYGVVVWADPQSIRTYFWLKLGVF